MNGPTISWDDDEQSIVFINQTLLPARFELVRCRSVERLASAIKSLEIRGAPALGAAGAFGIALAAVNSENEDHDAFLTELEGVANLLKETRPTAVNLGWGIDRVMSRIRNTDSRKEAMACAVQEAGAIAAEDAQMCRMIGKYGAELLPDRCTVLTHCNAGALACTEWGTALGVIRSARDMNKSVSVIACETRPLNQGSRLTAWELAAENIDVRVITDSSAAHLMRSGRIDAVIVGADRITRDAVFNKIGTYMHAVCAHHHRIPFYVAAPYSTFDSGKTEKDIIIEERGRDELAVCGNRMLMPNGVAALNYAFDATPLELVSAIITERGVMRPPYDIGERFTRTRGI